MLAELKGNKLTNKNFESRFVSDSNIEEKGEDSN